MPARTARSTKFVLPSVAFLEESVQSFSREPLPGRLLLTRNDRIEENIVRFGCLQISGCVTDHEDVISRIAAGRPLNMLRLAPKFLSTDE